MSHRCYICDRTDTFAITRVAEEFYSGPYYQDIRHPELDICWECRESIEEALDEFDKEESEDDWLPPEGHHG